MTFACRCLIALLSMVLPLIAIAQPTLPPVRDLPDHPTTIQSRIDDSGQLTWWLPEGADEYILPISAGVAVDTSRADLMAWLRAGSPWPLTELPTLGARYGQDILVLIIPAPHYAELVVEDRVGIRFSFPKSRIPAAPVEVIAQRRPASPLEVATAFRHWRTTATNIGEIPRPLPLSHKIAANEKLARLPGAPHFYLWGPALFSKHDVKPKQWPAFAKALHGAPETSFAGRLVHSFTPDQRSALVELSAAQWPMDYLTQGVASAIDTALTHHTLLGLPPDTPPAQVIHRNRNALAEAFAGLLNPPESWGDGLSNSLIDSFHQAGIDRALLVMSDLYGQSFRPDVLARAEALGYLVGPYDSYHSVHAPAAGPNDAIQADTWETAQFDLTAYEHGRILNADGSGHAGFKRRGYHFSPQAAWPYVQQRVNRILGQANYSAWFIDCDATAECFDDFSPHHPATRYDDTRLRRQRLAWLKGQHHLVVGSEGGSVLFADVIDFGHGVHTPYLGHLDPLFKDPQSPHFLGKYWPPDRPDQSFKPTPLPPALKTPYFDPIVRIPLYQAALGDELINTHHWSFDSLKFSDVQQTRELMEILYMIPPMYHLNRETWPKRRQHILRQYAFFSPLHRQLATAPLVGFEYLTADCLVQRTTFETPMGNISITVNFSDTPQAGHPPHSASVKGAGIVGPSMYEAKP
jgi:hypothetical protein